MFGNLGPAQSLAMLLVWLVAWLLPVAAVLWALVTLARRRRGQDAILARLAAIEAALAGGGDRAR
jgi:hypothetical protein